MNAVRRIAAVTAVYLLSVFFCIFGAASAYAYEDVCARIPVNCYEFAEADDLEYIIKIEPRTQGAPVPEKDVLEIDEDGTGFFDITITEPGTFRYDIFEIAGDDENIRYDRKNYSVTVFVELGDGDGLVYSVVANGLDGSKSPNIEFRNLTVSEKGVNGDMSDSATTSVTAAASTAVQTTATTAVTAAAELTAPAESKKGYITRIVDSALTGDSFPAYTVRAVLITAFAAALCTFLFRQKNSEEEEKTHE